MIKVKIITEGEREYILEEIEVQALNSQHGMQVLKSAAGYYIGMLYPEEIHDEKIWFPYSRDSACYWATREEAEEALVSGNYPVKF